MVPKGFQPINFCIAGPGFDAENNAAPLRGCDCQDNQPCRPGTCPCLQFGANYCDGRLDLQQNSNSNDPIIECHDDCQCASETCSNRVVGRNSGNLKDKLKVFDCGNIKGFGVRYVGGTPILAGEFVCEYVGEILGVEEAKKRLLIKNQLPNSEQQNYLILLREHLANGDLLLHCVDASCYGNVARFINHSCSPNLLMTAVRVGTAMPRLCLFAKRQISNGEEITFDYGSDDDCGDNENLADNSGFKKPCLCLSVACRKWLPFHHQYFD